ncbi:barstar family protein [Gordonia caeni]|uniref:Barstar (barnase inhibitor) domain-containing protein n=1 Tax=Gordonia caeni TaxID=1007097 RepID=A0ABP7PPB1_9ACTN
MTTAAFLRNAARAGSPVGLCTSQVRTYGSEVVTRRIDGAAARTLDGLFAAFAAAWDFPPHFGGNKDAFDDCIRDLSPHLRTPTGAPATGYLTVVENAPQLLAAAHDRDFRWFATSLSFYRDSYRDDPDHPRGFTLVLVCPPAEADATRERWAEAGVRVVTVHDRRGF